MNKQKLCYTFLMSRRSAQRITRGSMSWEQWPNPRKADVQRLADAFGLSAEHTAVLGQPTHRTRLFEGEGYLLLILAHPLLSETHGTSHRELDIILTEKALVTIPYHPFPELDQAFADVQAATRTRVPHPVTLLGKLLHRLAEEVYTDLDRLSLVLDDLEQHVANDNKNVLSKAFQVQTSLLDMQKAIAAQDIIYDRLYAALSSTGRKHFAAWRDELKQHEREILVNLETEQKTALSVHQAAEAVLNKRTNRMINLLTRLSLFLLPSTLLAGIFGMNAKHPWILGNTHDFTIVILLMFLTVIIVSLAVRFGDD